MAGTFCQALGARHVTGCHFTQSMSVHSALDDQSDKIWRIDLQDDPQDPVILSSCQSTGHYDQIVSCHSVDDVAGTIHQALDPGINNNLYRYYIMSEPKAVRPDYSVPHCLM